MMEWNYKSLAGISFGSAVRWGAPLAGTAGKDAEVEVGDALGNETSQNLIVVGGVVVMNAH